MYEDIELLTCVCVSGREREEGREKKCDGGRKISYKEPALSYRLILSRYITRRY